MENYKVNANTLHIRKEPSINGRIIGYLKKEEIVFLITLSGDQYWYKVKREDGMKGWISHKFLERIDNDIDDVSTVPWLLIAKKRIRSKRISRE